MKPGAELLRDWMERTGYGKQADVAELLGMHESFLSMLLSGKRVPKLTNAVKIERLTGIPVAAWTLSDVDESEAPVAAGAGKRRIHKQSR